MKKFLHIISNLSPKLTSIGFIMAGAYNLLGILGFTQLFTNRTLIDTDPVVFSWLGQIIIILWGLAYWTQTRQYTKNGALLVVFCIEKCLYVVAWAMWLVTHLGALRGLFSQSVAMGLFFASYGLGDLMFGVFFGITAYRVLLGDFRQPEITVNTGKIAS